MLSFTSAFKKYRYFVVVFLALVLSLAFCVGYTFKQNPEVRFWGNAASAKFNYVNELNSGKPRFIFVGGSSCAFSINPKLIDPEIQANCVNMGMHGGTGRAYQIEVGLQVVRPGDTLVLAFETGFWRDRTPVTHNDMGVQTHYVTRHHFRKEVQIEKLGVDYDRSVVRLFPGGYHMVTRVVRMGLGREPYRYRDIDIQPNGPRCF